MIIDSHCHLNMPEFKKDIANVIANAKKSNLEGVLTICTRLEELNEIKSLSDKFKLWYSGGIHPCNIEKNAKINLNVIKKYAKNKNFIGIGETGLDFFHSCDEKIEQIDSFNKHIEIARELDLPVIIHSRSADKETIKIILEQYKIKPFKGLIHCFTASRELALAATSIGLLISIAGIITFKNAESLRETVRAIPINKLLIETDSPYLAPVPFRGKRNEPSYVKHTAQYLANLKNITFMECIKETNKNFYKLFSKAKTIL